MASTLSSLSANDITSGIQGLTDVFGGSDHVHDGNTSSVEFVNYPAWGHTNSAHEKLGLLGNDNVDQLCKKI